MVFITKTPAYPMVFIIMTPAYPMVFFTMTPAYPMVFIIFAYFGCLVFALKIVDGVRAILSVPTYVLDRVDNGFEYHAVICCIPNPLQICNPFHLFYHDSFFIPQTDIFLLIITHC